jgi:hypothetical protein
MFYTNQIYDIIYFGQYFYYSILKPLNILFNMNNKIDMGNGIKY